MHDPSRLSTSVKTREPYALSERVDSLCSILEAEAEAADSEGAITAAAWLALRSSRLLLAPLPTAFGGEDLGSAETINTLVMLLRRIGAADLSVARIVEGHINGVMLVRRYGTDAQVQSLASAIAAGGLSGVWGAEGKPPLTATRVAGGWKLDGGKVLASGAGCVTHPIVLATTAEGPWLMVPRLQRDERTDLSSWTPQGMRASATGSVDLSGLTLPEDAAIGRPSDFTRQPAFSGGAWRFCAVHLGAMERLLDLLRNHLVVQSRESDPYQLQRVAQATVAVTTARFWIETAATMLAEETAAASTIVAFSNLTRTVTERAALDVLELVHRGVGLRSFMRPHPIERISRDLATYLRQPVPDLAMADAARTILAMSQPAATLWTNPR